MLSLRSGICTVFLMLLVLKSLLVASFLTQWFTTLPFRKFGGYRNTLYDFFLIDLISFGILAGLLCGAMIGNPDLSTKRIRGVLKPLAVLQIVIHVYCTVKFLIYADNNDPDKFDFIVYVLTAPCSFLFLIPYLILIRFSKPTLPDANESTPLLNGKNNDSVKSMNIFTALLKITLYSKKDWRILFIASFFLVAASAVSISLPYFVGRIVDAAIVLSSTQIFAKNIMLYLIGSLLTVCLACTRGFFFSVFIARQFKRLRADLYHAIIWRPLGYFDRAKTGDLLSRLSNDITTISTSLGLNLNILLRTLLSIFGTFIFMCLMSWKLFLLSSVTTPVALLSLQCLSGLMQKIQEEIQDNLATINNTSSEALVNIKTVKSFAAENYEEKRFGDEVEKLYKKAIYCAKLNVLYQFTSQSVFPFILLSALTYGGHLVMNGGLSSGKFLSFIVYQIEVLEHFDLLGSTIADLIAASGASTKIFEIIDSFEEPDKGWLQPKRFDGSIEFRNVTIAYDSRLSTYALKNVSFTIPAGTHAALVGHSGSGKTSCMSALKNFIPPTEGEILIDGQPVKNFDYKYLHNRVSLVDQEPVLFADSIKNNVVYGLSDEKLCNFTNVRLACERANADSFIKLLPEGYDTPCGERGHQLSGGQKQRIAIARSLVREPRVVLLDEATSALDTEAEFLVQQAIDNCFSDRTVLVVAHRLSSVKNADKIIVLKDGCKVEEGTHNELLRLKGHYFSLVNKQINYQSSNESDDSTRAQPRGFHFNPSKTIPIFYSKRNQFDLRCHRSI